MRAGLFGWFGQWTSPGGAIPSGEEPFPLEGTAQGVLTIGATARGSISIRGTAQREGS